ncbi:LuxR C-terminal-related transcriptional regulator [Streptomyces sp. AMCC400023]|uniref:helix-turn-helix transcriptional regulator n=1 Tax=Streptomyces sp. AMCC400023 TaxID=2056258 RepID=UPI003FA71ACB
MSSAAPTSRRGRCSGRPRGRRAERIAPCSASCPPCAPPTPGTSTRRAPRSPTARGCWTHCPTRSPDGRRRPSPCSAAPSSTWNGSRTRHAIWPADRRRRTRTRAGPSSCTGCWPSPWPSSGPAGWTTPSGGPARSRPWPAPSAPKARSPWRGRCVRRRSSGPGAGATPPRPSPWSRRRPRSPRPAGAGGPPRRRVCSPRRACWPGTPPGAVGPCWRAWAASGCPWCARSPGPSSSPCWPRPRWSAGTSTGHTISCGPPRWRPAGSACRCRRRTCTRPAPGCTPPTASTTRRPSSSPWPQGRSAPPTCRCGTPGRWRPAPPRAPRRRARPRPCGSWTSPRRSPAPTGLRSYGSGWRTCVPNCPGATRRHTRWGCSATANARSPTWRRKGCAPATSFERLFLSPRTVETHLFRVYRKLGVSSRLTLSALLRRTG